MIPIYSLILILEYFTGKLATANKSGVNIRVTKKLWPEHLHGRLCKKFPLVQFDQHGKFGCCFSYRGHMQEVPKILADAAVPPLGMGAWLTH